jgi:hypothetical protein
MKSLRALGICVLTAAVFTSCASHMETRIAIEQPPEFSGDGPSMREDHPVGFEIIEIVSGSEMRAWVSTEIDRKGFDDLRLPMGWIKNQPRESEPDFGRFFHSPDAPTDGEYQDGDAFGYSWRHVATIVDPRHEVDQSGLLSASIVHKHHELLYVAGRTATVLTSPDGDVYIRVTRDANRTQETPTIPDGWTLSEVPLDEDLRLVLPEYTTVIRSDNEDSFQGPVNVGF